MKKDCANLACGSIFLPDWINLDYAPSPPWVQQCNLLRRLPVQDCSCRVVYTSHFFEHIPISKSASFLAEAYRILKPGGTIRIVTPDFSAICNAYISALHKGDTHQARFIQLEILDQCVRKKPGGELGKLYKSICQAGSGEEHQSIKKLIYKRTGEKLSDCLNERTPRFQKINERLAHPKAALHLLSIRLRVKIACWIAPSAFVEQNISLAAIGENHTWLYTFDELQSMLENAGFLEPQRMSFDTSNILDFPCDHLDMHPDGEPRQGAGSMYLEARKPL